MSNFMKADYEEPKASTGDWLKFEDGDTHYMLGVHFGIDF